MTGHRLDFIAMSKDDRARLARLWAIDRRSLVSLTRDLGAPDRDAWHIKCAIECFVFDWDPSRYDAICGRFTPAAYRRNLRDLAREALKSQPAA